MILFFIWCVSGHVYGYVSSTVSFFFIFIWFVFYTFLTMVSIQLKHMSFPHKWSTNLIHLFNISRYFTLSAFCTCVLNTSSSLPPYFTHFQYNCLYLIFAFSNYFAEQNGKHETSFIVLDRKQKSIHFSHINFSVSLLYTYSDDHTFLQLSVISHCLNFLHKFIIVWTLKKKNTAMMQTNWEVNFIL